MIAWEKGLPEPGPGGVVLVRGMTGTAFQRWFSDGLWHGGREPLGLSWDEVVDRSGADAPIILSDPSEDGATFTVVGGWQGRALTPYVLAVLDGGHEITHLWDDLVEAWSVVLTAPNQGQAIADALRQVGDWEFVARCQDCEMAHRGTYAGVARVAATHRQHWQHTVKEARA